MWSFNNAPRLHILPCFNAKSEGGLIVRKWVSTGWWHLAILPTLKVDESAFRAIASPQMKNWGFTPGNFKRVRSVAARVSLTSA